MILHILLIAIVYDLVRRNCMMRKQKGFISLGALLILLVIASITMYTAHAVATESLEITELFDFANKSRTDAGGVFLYSIKCS